MTYMELATYLGMANVLMREAEADDETGIMTNIRKALCEAQVYFAKKGLEELTNNLEGDVE